MRLTTVVVSEQHLSRMRLSVRSMLSDVLAGKCAFYQVLEPEEAIAVVTLVGRRWRVDDVRGERNRAATTVDS